MFLEPGYGRGSWQCSCSPKQVELAAEGDFRDGVGALCDLSLEEHVSCSIMNSMPRCAPEFPRLMSQVMAVAREPLFV